MIKKNWVILDSVICIIVNIVLFGLKMWAGITSNSLAIISDAWDTLSDSVSSLIIAITTYYYSKPADKGHPYGHGQLEAVVTLFLGFILALIAFSFTKEALINLKTKEVAIYSKFAIIITIISLIIKEILARFALLGAKKTKSSILLANAHNYRGDALRSVIILLGIILGTNFWWIDSCLTIIVALIMFKASYGVVKGAINQLMGQEVSLEIIETICLTGKELGLNSNSFHHFHIHRYGDHYELTFHIRLPANMSLIDAHQKTIILEEAIYNNLGYNSTIHIEPLKFI